MPLPQAPREGGRDRTIWFRYCPTAKEGTWHGWIAGPAQWFKVHQKGKTKPCLTNMTRGAVRCQRCVDGATIDRVAYVPLYRCVDAKAVCVIVHEDAEEMLEKLTLHMRVIVGREAGATDGVWITEAPKQVRYETTLPERTRAADITESCLRMWSIPELDKWYRESEYVHGSRPVMNDTPLSLAVSASSVDELDAGVIELRKKLAERSAPVKKERETPLHEVLAAAHGRVQLNGKPK